MVHEKRDVGTSWLILGAEISGCLLALIWDKSYVEPLTTLLDGFFSCHAQTALPIIDQEPVGWGLRFSSFHGTPSSELLYHALVPDVRDREVFPAKTSDLPITAPSDGAVLVSKRVRVLTAILLVTLMLMAAMSPLFADVQPSTPDSSPVRQVIRDGFFFGLPLLLAILVLAGLRWALMVAVMYGTLGLALDLATIIQDLDSADTQPLRLVMYGTTGLLNLLVIGVGGYGFLDVRSTATPPTHPRPQPPSPPET